MACPERAFRGKLMLVTRAPAGLVLACLLFGCGNGTPSTNPDSGGGTGGSAAGGAGNSGGVSGSASGSGPVGGSGVAGDTSGGAAGAGGSGGSAPGGSGGSTPTWGIETRPTGQTCVPPATRDAAPVLLSATGCVDPMDPKKPAQTLIPYTVASALWSDAATAVSSNQG